MPARNYCQTSPATVLVATHVFLEVLHYGVWLVALPLIRVSKQKTAAAASSPARSDLASPIARHPRAFPSWSLLLWRWSFPGRDTPGLVLPWITQPLATSTLQWRSHTFLAKRRFVENALDLECGGKRSATPLWIDQVNLLNVYLDYKSKAASRSLAAALQILKHFHKTALPPERVRSPL